MTKTTKPKANPKLLDSRVPFESKGRIHGTGRRLTPEEKAQAIRLRKRDPETFSLRRLAVAYGIDPASMYYALNGGRSAIVERRERAEARAKARRASVRQAKLAKAA